MRDSISETEKDERVTKRGERGKERNGEELKRHCLGWKGGERGDGR